MIFERRVGPIDGVICSVFAYLLIYLLFTFQLSQNVFFCAKFFSDNRLSVCPYRCDKILRVTLKLSHQVYSDFIEIRCIWSGGVQQRGHSTTSSHARPIISGFLPRKLVFY